MNAIEIISELKDKYSEWLEMSDRPHEFIMGVMANKIIKLEGHIEYLERRLKK